MREFFQWSGPSVALYDAHHFDDRGKPMEGDVDYYRKWARRMGGPILELACGTGRVTLPLARDGYDVIGLDLSPHMLAIARAKAAAERGLKLRLVRGDMAAFRLRRRFKLILIPFRAFAHLLTPEEQRRCLTSVRRHLATGGRLILDIFDPKLDYCLPGREKAVLSRETLRNPRTGNPVEIQITDRKNDPIRQTFRETWNWTERNGKGRVVRRIRESLTLRWTYRYEMQHLLELCGLRPVACHGDFRGGPPRYGAEQIWVAEAVPRK